jgi:hypothetical protein
MSSLFRQMSFLYENWKIGQIIDQYSRRSYVVQNEDGVKYRRNRVKIAITCLY